MIRPLPGILLIVLALFSAGCLKKAGISGKELVDREVLVDVIVDLHMIDGITNDRKFHRKYEADSIDLHTPVFEKHHITREMFDTTMAVYSKRPGLLDQVYNDVLIKLNVKLDEKDKGDKEKTNTPEGLPLRR